MIVHLFHSSIVSGPESLVIPALRRLEQVALIFLVETRLGEKGREAAQYAHDMGHLVFEIEVTKRIDRKAIRELREWFKESPPTLVHAHDVKASSYLAEACAQIPERSFPLFSTHHGVRGRSGFRAKAYENYYVRCVLPKFDRVFTVCMSDRDLLCGRGLCPDKVVAHPNGVDRAKVLIEQRQRVSEDIRKRWNVTGLSDRTICLGVVGRLAPEKCLDRVLETASLLKKKRDADWKVLFFGDGPERKRLQERSNKLGLQEHVHWMGYRAEIKNEFAGFDLLLSFSRAEGMPINLIEAGWAATPVFATAVDGNRELIPSERFGTLFDVRLGEDEIARLLARILAQPDSLAVQGRNFQRRVESSYSGLRWLSELEYHYSPFIHPKVLSNVNR